MKKIILLLCLALLGFTSAVRAGVLIGSLSPIIYASTNSTTFLTNTTYLTVPVIYVSNNGLAITNAYSGLFRYSFDNSTFYTNASPVFIPTATNAATYTISGQTIAVPIYIQMIAYTNTANTSTVNIGVSTP